MWRCSDGPPPSTIRTSTIRTSTPHARFAEGVREAGFAFLADPAATIVEYGVWHTEALGAAFVFPYSAAFHLPFALAPLGYDATMSAMKLAAVALSVVPVVLTWLLAQRLGLPALPAALLMVAVPTYGTRLSFAFLPALLGHVFDLLVVLWLAHALPRLERPAAFALGVLTITASQLAYVSGLLNTGALVAGVGLVLLVARQPRQALLLATIGASAAGLALALYYRHFLGGVFEALPALGGGAAAPDPRYAPQSFVAVALGRTRDFFGVALPLLAGAGLVLALRRSPGPRTPPGRLGRRGPAAAARARQTAARVSPRPRDDAADAARLPGRGRGAREPVATRPPGAGRRRRVHDLGRRLGPARPAARVPGPARQRALSDLTQ